MRVHRKHPMVLAFAAMGLFALTTSGASADPQPIHFTHNVVDAPAPVTSAVFGTGPPVKTGTAICTTPTQTGANANTDCETTSVGPHNETSIAVNPTDPDNMIGGVNDYQLAVNPGGHVSETVLSRAHVTFDGGQTWSSTRSTPTPRTRRRATRRLRSTRRGTRTTGPSDSGSLAP